MKKKIELLLLIALCATLIMGVFTLPANAADIPRSGTYNTNFTWSFDEKNTLTISGSGVLYGPSMISLPWDNWTSSITNLVLQGEITTIKSGVFSTLSLLESVTFPATVSDIESGAFTGNHPDRVISYVYYGGTKAEWESAYHDSEYIINTNTIHYSASGHTYVEGFCSVCGWEENVIDTGSCGTNVTWKIYSNGLLSIVGTGDISWYNSGYSNAQPWNKYSSQVLSVEVSDGITSIPSYAFYNHTNMKSAVIGKNVESIGSYAFEYCSNLESMTLGSGVKTIGSYAFYSCSKLTDIEIPNSVESIGGGAFYNCSSLESVTLGSGLKTIGGYAFYSCSKLTDIEIPNSIESIGSYAFNSCSNLESVTIGSGVKLIGEYAFTGCSKLTDIEIPNSVESIGSWAFQSCSNLESVTLGSGVKTIGGYAFSYCGKLTSIEITNSVESIDSFAFQFCSNLESVTLGSGVKTIGSDAFAGCSKLKTVSYEGTLESWTQIFFSNTSSNPCWNGAYIYVDGDLLTSLTIPETTTSIPDYVFSGCISIAEIYFEGDKPSFSSSVFSNVHAIAFYPNGNTTYQGIESSITNLLWLDDSYIGKDMLFYGSCGSNAMWRFYKNGTLKIEGSGNMFDYNSTTQPWKDYVTFIKNIVIADGITGIGSYAFYNCSYAGSVEIGNSVKVIGTYAFSQCSNLREINIPDSVESISSYAFSYCSYAGGVEIGNGVKTIGTYAFSQCSNLREINIPDSVESISSYAFEGCCSLTEITIPNSVNSLGSGTFRNCSSVEKVSLGTGMISIDSSTFSSCNSLREIEIPENIKSIGTDAFSGCSSIESIVIPDSVESIGAGCFRGCSTLKELTIPFVGNSRETNDRSAKYPLGYIFGTSSYTGSIKVRQYYYYSSPSSSMFYDYYIPTSLKSITVTGGSIFYGAFFYCSMLESITLPDDLTNIGEYAFSYCTGLKSIELPDKLTVISSGVFGGCGGLTEITIPSGVTSIGDSAFRYCTGLAEISIPASVNTIGGYAFSNDSNLKKIVFNGKPSSIDSYAFSSVNAEADYYYEDNWPTSMLLNYGGTLGWKLKTHHAFDTIDITELPESEHNYSSSCNEKYTIEKEDAVKLTLKFNDSTSLGAQSIIMITDMNGNSTSYADNELAGKTIEIDGSKAVIWLSAGGTEGYGFKLDSAVASIAHHEYSTTYVWSEDYSTCTATRVCACYDKELITETVDSVRTINKEVKCVEDGEYKFTATFTNSIFEEQIHTETIPAHGHYKTIRDKVTDDYYELVNSSSYPFSLSNGWYTSSNHNQSSDSTFTINAKYDSTLVLKYSVSSESGCDYLRISKNGTNVASVSGSYSNQTATIDLAAGDVVTITYHKDGSVDGGSDTGSFMIESPLHGTVVKEVSYPVDELAATCEYAIVCSYCNQTIKDALQHTYTAKVEDEKYIVAPATCLENATYYYSCSVCGATDTAHTFEGSKGSHSFGEPTYEWSEDMTTCTATHICKIESSHVETETVDVTQRITYPSSVEKRITYYAEFTNKGFTNQTTSKRFTAGTCGDGVLWTLDNEGTLTISGSGTVTSSSWPKSSVRKLVAEDITAINMSVSYTTYGYSYGSAAFNDCYNLKSVSIPGTVKSIRSNTFDNCNSLERVDIADIKAWCEINFETSKDNPLLYAKRLYLNNEEVSSLVIPDGTESIGKYAFYNLSSINSVTIPTSISEIGQNAFSGCSGLTYVFYKGNEDSWNNLTKGVGNTALTNAFIHYNSTGHNFSGGICRDCGFHSDWFAYGKCGEEVCWWIDNQYTLTISGSGAMTSAPWIAFASQIKKIVVEDEVTAIMSGAFSGFGSLESITIPFVGTSDSDSSTFGSVFGRSGYNGGMNVYPGNYYDEYFCVPSGLKTVILTDGNVKNRAFSKCSMLETITLPNDITTIGAYAFNSCTGLTNIDIPNGVLSIGESAFSNCTGLKSVSLPKNTSKIQSYAFSHCTGLESVNISEGVYELTYGIFEGCSGLKSVDIPDNIKTISGGVFTQCDSLEEINFGSGIKTIEKGCFDYDNIIKKISYSGDIASWIGIDFSTYETLPLFKDYSLYIGGSLVENLVIPEGVESVGALSLAGCSSLKSVEFNNVAYIGQSAFYGCKNLKSASFGENIGRIGCDAFNGCESLRYIDIKDMDVWCKTIFENEMASPLRSAENLRLNGNVVTNAVITSGTEKISAYAFENYKKLNSITIPESVEEIGYNAFKNCTNIKYIFYGGDEEAWTNMKVASGNTDLFSVVVHYSSTGHNVVTENAKDATCTEEGYNEYSYCSTCGLVIVEKKTTAAIGHDWGASSYEWSDDYSTCTATRVCKHNSEHVESEQVNAVEAGKTDATCSQRGVTTYTATFTNTSFTKQTEHTYTEKTAHDFGEVSYLWSIDKSKCTAIRVCKNDATHVETEIVDTENRVTSDPSVTKNGTREYTAKFTNHDFSNQTLTVYINSEYKDIYYELYEIRVTSSGNGQVSPEDKFLIEAGETLTLTMSPDKNYHVEDVKIDGKSVGAVTQYTIDNVDANHSVEVTFAKSASSISTLFAKIAEMFRNLFSIFKISASR